jgi:hypothetical protein
VENKTGALSLAVKNLKVDGRRFGVSINFVVDTNTEGFLLCFIHAMISHASEWSSDGKGGMLPLHYYGSC